MGSLLIVNQIYKSFDQHHQVLDDISLVVESGTCLGIVGESGSGKSTLARIILGLLRPDRGEVLLNGNPLHMLRGEALRKARKDLQVVFQDPTASLNRRMPIWKSVMEPLDNFPEDIPYEQKSLRHSRKARKELAVYLLERVGLSSALLDRLPQQLSGGQRQRVAIARGLSLQPKLLILDEPTASLDVSVQAQILNLLQELQQSLGMSYLFISHDIAAVRYMSSRIAVLKNGVMVDSFDREHMFNEMRHHYTKALVEAAR